MTSLINLLTNL